VLFFTFNRVAINFVGNKIIHCFRRKPTAQFFDLKQNVINARPDWSRRWYVTCGADRSVKVSFKGGFTV